MPQRYMGEDTVESGDVYQFGGRLTGGCCTLPDRRGLSSFSSGSGWLYVAFFRSPDTFTASRMRVASSGNAAGATPTLVRAGVWSVADSGDLTQIGATANDTTVFATNNTAYTRALTSPASLTEGQWYAAGVLTVTAAAVPSLLCSPGPTGCRQVLFAAPKLSAAVSGLSDLPATVAASALLSTDICIYAELLA